MSVRETDEIRRVRDAPSRSLDDYPTEALIEILTQSLKSPTGTMRLRAKQALLLTELYTHGTAFAAIQVGGGKTLPSLLAPRMVGAKRPAYIAPANTVKKRGKRPSKTAVEAAEYAKHWELPVVSIQSYQTLSRDGGYEWLVKHAPDLLVFDEFHCLGNPQSSVTLTIEKYLKEYRTKQPIWIVGLTGSLESREMMECWHLLRWTLGDNAPVPRSRSEASVWSDAMSSKLDFRPDPGPLLSLGESSPNNEPHVRAREAWGDRLRRTPGVIVSGTDRPAAGIAIRGERVYLPAEAEQHLSVLRQYAETPDGWPVDDAFSVWRHARSLALGYFSYWDPRPPDYWLDARRGWSVFVRDTLAATDRYGTSAMALANAVTNGALDDGGLLAHWQEVRTTFKPNERQHWIHDVMLQWCARWLESNQGICWADSRPFGDRLAALTGHAHFTRYGADVSRGLTLDTYTGPAIAQVKACNTGLNCQQYSKNCMPSFGTKGAPTEQTLGRTHRSNQQAAVVTFDVAFACIEQVRGFRQAEKDAWNFTHKRLGEMRLTYADISGIPDLSDFETLKNEE